MRISNFNFRKVMLLIVDAVIISICGVISNFILQVLDFQTGFRSIVETPYVVVSILINVIICICCLFICGAYNKAWRYFNAKDYLSCLIGMVAGVVLSTLVLSLRYNSFNYVLPYTLISGGLSVVGVVLFRLIFKRAFIKINDAGAIDVGERTLIVGAGNAGRIILEDIFNAKQDSDNPSKSIFPVGFIDDDILKQNNVINSVRVLGQTTDIPKICEKENISLIIFAIPSCEEEERKRSVVQMAIGTLSYSEIEAVEQIFSELDGNEGLLVASKIADRSGITRSVIVNALRKLESAGVIESRSLGMKGTFIRILNDKFIEEISKDDMKLY